MTNSERLRALPSVDVLLRHENVVTLRDHVTQAQITTWVRAVVQECREHLLKDQLAINTCLTGWIVDRVLQKANTDLGQRLQPVINATGVVLHTNLGRSPMPEQAIRAAENASRYTNVELDLESAAATRSSGDGIVSRTHRGRRCFGCEQRAAATVLVLQLLAAGQEVVVSRGQLVEIGGGFRLPDVFRAAGVTLREVGTTNRTYLRDYEAAVNENTGAVIRVHRSNFSLSGFVTEPGIDELVQMERPDTVAVIDDLGSGSMIDMTPYGVEEPNVIDSVRSGADVSLFSGDKLFGGPQAGILVGKKRWIEKLRRSPIMRAMRVDKLTLAALEATTEIHLSGKALTELPTLQMITTNPDTIRQRCETLISRINHPDFAKLIPCESQVGGGSVPGFNLASFAVQITGFPPHHLARHLRTGETPVQTRVTDDSLILDLRTVSDSQLPVLATNINAAIAKSEIPANTEPVSE